MSRYTKTAVIQKGRPVMQRHHREAIAWLRKQGATDCILVEGKKHKKIVFNFRGERRSLVICPHWFANWKAYFLRSVKGVRS